MSLLYYDPRFLEHDTGSRHPERPSRLVQIVRQLERTQLIEQFVRPQWQPLEPAGLALVHPADYVARVAQFAEAGGGRIEADTIVSPASYDVARLAAGAAVDAVRRVVGGEDTQAMCLVRPPGHHALPDVAMGFCLFNNVALAARAATEELGLDRVLIVDWDVHHGNGTQDVFWTDSRVGFLSIHRWPFYPGTGDKDETGSGPGLGTTVNLPVAYGTPVDEYFARFRAALETFADRLRPQLVLIGAGYDAHREDLIGSLDLEIEDFASLTQMVLEVAATHSGGRVVSILEGGYNTSILAGCVETHARELLARGG